MNSAWAPQYVNAVISAINCGGHQISSSEGINYLYDNYYDKTNPSTKLNIKETLLHNDVNDVEIRFTARAPPAGGNVKYDIPVPIESCESSVMVAVTLVSIPITSEHAPFKLYVGGRCVLR